MEKRSSFQIQLAVINALARRELKTRFGQYRLGIVWALLEPLMQMLFFMVMFHFRGMSGVGGLALPIFLATGLAPFQYFNRVVNQASGAVSANRNLFIYRQVRVFDAFLVRFLLEAIISFVVLITLIAGTWWAGYDVAVYDSILFLQVYLLLSFLSFGISLIVGVITTLYPEPAKFVPFLLRPLFFISGTFFSINEMPAVTHDFLLWNPLLHAFELFRSTLSVGYDSSLVSLNYLRLFTLFALTLGMLMYRANWRKMLTV
ncbi:hypothetical protein GZ77_17435 [Endozoicomonas montiporae]|uniref:Transport permease protein n=2 Tax=Endozoicomonas montiporae TaxID=1027273 RepID=A0A081N1L3_9GAMM|nr:ABC transporter permease [Endozoicomonas montiporae]AMO58733.1 capsular polysaccharide transport system permease protein [Endozoicomonas montiporae CL-33]KEQ12336.1 hypothetical protein GZ77_17435 [Endozoicomonas montiporae]